MYPSKTIVAFVPSYNGVYIHLHQLVVGQTFSPCQTMLERATAYDKVWTETICFQKNSPLIEFSCTGHCMHYLFYFFLKCLFL